MIGSGAFFRSVPNPKPLPLIDIDTPLLALGSCFVENMTNMLQRYKVPLVANPTGVLYNPLSIAELLSRLERGDLLTYNDIFEAQGEYRSYLTHTHLNRDSADEYLKVVNSNLSKARESLERATVVLVTLGSAMVWKLKSSGAVVANCQKQPGNLFERVLLSEVEVTDALQRCCQSIKQLNTQATIIFTVSPVRYEKARPFLNSVSKGRLFSGLEKLVNEIDIHYFPAYEVLIDELREYRFYAEDYVHPSSLAVTYIWERFLATFGTEQFSRFIPLYDEVRKIQCHCEHRGCRALEGQLLKSVTKKIAAVENTFSITLSEERDFFGLT